MSENELLQYKEKIFAQLDSLELTASSTGEGEANDLTRTPATTSTPRAKLKFSGDEDPSIAHISNMPVTQKRSMRLSP